MSARGPKADFQERLVLARSGHSQRVRRTNPTGPRKARPNDRLRREPGIHNHHNKVIPPPSSLRKHYGMHTSFDRRPARTKKRVLSIVADGPMCRRFRNRGSSKSLYLSEFSRCVHALVRKQGPIATDIDCCRRPLRQCPFLKPRSMGPRFRGDDP